MVQLYSSWRVRLANFDRTFDVKNFDEFDTWIACVAAQTKQRYSPSANQPVAKSLFCPLRVPGFSMIGCNWLLHMTAVLSCTVIGRVDLVEP